MNYQEIEAIYLDKEKYTNELDVSRPDFQRLLIETVEWKMPHLMEMVPPTFHAESVAEIGCFNGHLIANIAINGRRDFASYGYDVNPIAIEAARKLYPNTTFFAQDCFEAGRTFDLVLLSDIVEHIEDDCEFLRKCRSLSKHILLNLPLEKSLANVNRQYGFDDPSGHLRAYSLKDAELLIRKAGYQIVNKQVVSIVDTPVDKKRRKIDSAGNVGMTFADRSKALTRGVLGRIPLLPNLIYSSNLFAFLEVFD
jgi:SAM-dependent methyltransferase